jgi:DNA-binding NtrC family response regulator
MATILVVEDNASLREMIHEVLEGEGYVVLEAADADQALSVSRSHEGTIHLALTDVIQPKMRGEQIAEALLADRPGMRILYMSGYPSSAINPDGEPDPTIHFIEKPFSTVALLTKVREVLEGPPSKPGT